jgi:hypothetical protein
MFLNRYIATSRILLVSCIIPQSVSYIDPETNKSDSERAAAKIVRRQLEQFIPTLSVGDSTSIAASDIAAIQGRIGAAIKAKSDEFGLEVLSVDIR